MSLTPGDLARCDQLYAEANDALMVIADGIRSTKYWADDPASVTFVRLVSAIHKIPYDKEALIRMVAVALTLWLEKERAE